MSNLIKFPTGSKEQFSNENLQPIIQYQIRMLDRDMRRYRRKRTDILTIVTVFFFGMATGLSILALLGVY